MAPAFVSRAACSNIVKQMRLSLAQHHAVSRSYFTYLLRFKCTHKNAFLFVDHFICVHLLARIVQIHVDTDRWRQRDTHIVTAETQRQADKKLYFQADKFN